MQFFVAVRPLAAIYCSRLLSTVGRGGVVLLRALRRVRLRDVHVQRAPRPRHHAVLCVCGGGAAARYHLL